MVIATSTPEQVARQIRSRVTVASVVIAILTTGDLISAMPCKADHRPRGVDHSVAGPYPLEEPGAARRVAEQTADRRLITAPPRHQQRCTIFLRRARSARTARAEGQRQCSDFRRKPWTGRGRA